ncbi:MAG: HD domain-containing protein [Pirellulaceae bacterium]|nr:HD domain-containing protein [Pirellulaceae bacterium]
MQPILQRILATFEQRGNRQYGQEAVTQLQHALQSGQLALRSGATDKLTVAALLHDIGHLLVEEAMPESCKQNLDDKHETIGYSFLHTHFGKAVADPVRLHVVAKRYLCTTKPDYESKLSPTSCKSYHDQGGPMTPEEQQAFEAEPFYHDALRLRHWDDTAKDPQAETVDLNTFLPQIQSCLKENIDR